MCRVGGDSCLLVFWVVVWLLFFLHFHLPDSDNARVSLVPKYSCLHEKGATYKEAAPF